MEANKLLLEQISNLQIKISDLLEVEMKHFAPDIPEDVYDVVTYLFKQGGKRLRPAFFVQLAQQLNGVKDLGPFALAIELIHNMSLYHDDVIDGANERRGSPTVHHNWDVATAIVGGDVLHSLIHHHVLNAAKVGRAEFSVAFDFLHDLLEVEIEIGNSVLLEMQKAKENELPIMKESLRITAGKTAPLFAFSAKSAGIIAGRGEIADQLYEFGYQFGLGFQLLDDLLDYFATDKDIGGDIREGKKTPILLLMSEKSPQLIKAYLNKSVITEEEIINIRDNHKTEFLEIISWVEKYLDTANEKLKSLGIEMTELEILFNLVVSKIEMIKNYYN